MRCLFLNQYFPPDAAPTGVLLQELADELVAHGHTVDFASATEAYRHGQKPRGRLRREARALAQMLWRGLRSPRPDVVFSATSPPCLIVVATLVALWHRAQPVHWAMDLYPEIAVALGEIRDGVPARCLTALTGWCYRRQRHVVVLDADMAAQLARHKVSTTTIRPWVSTPVLQAAARANAAPSEPWTWIYSGNLGRAHEWETLLNAQQIIEAEHDHIHLLFQGGGPAWPAAQVRARELGLRHAAWSGYVAEDELPASLLRCNAVVATQRVVARGLLWPSKLGLITSLPRPIIWVGPTEGAIADWLRPLPQVSLFKPGDAAGVARQIISLAHAGTAENPIRPLDPADYRRSALASWLEIFGKLCPSHYGDHLS